MVTTHKAEKRHFDARQSILNLVEHLDVDEAELLALFAQLTGNCAEHLEIEFGASREDTDNVLNWNIAQGRLMAHYATHEGTA